MICAKLKFVGNFNIQNNICEIGKIKDRKQTFSPKVSAALYFSKYRQPTDAIIAMVHDKEFGNKKYEPSKSLPDTDNVLFAGTGKVRAASALEWVRASMSEEG